MAISKIESLASFNLTQSALALSQSLRKQTLPYIYIRNRKSSNPLAFQQACLRINDKLDEDDYKNFQFHSIWSLKHLNLLKQRVSKKQLKKTIVMNPFKSYELLHQSMELGISSMVIHNIDEIQKIQKFRYQLKRHTSKSYPIEFLWEVNDFKETWDNLTILKKYSFNITGLVVPEDLETKPHNISQLMKYSQKLGHPLKQAIIQASVNNYMKKLNDYDQIREKARIEILDLDRTDNYTILCRVLGYNQQKEPVLADECYDLLQQSMGIKQMNGSLWVQGKPMKILLNENNVISLCQ